MDAASRLRVQSVNQLADLALHSSTRHLVSTTTHKHISPYPVQVFRDIKLTHPLHDDEFDDLISVIRQESMIELRHAISTTIPQKFQNDNHVMSTCATILRHRKTFLHSSLLYFVVAVIMSKTELLSKAIKYFVKSLEIQPDLKSIFEHKYYLPSEGLSRKV